MQIVLVNPGMPLEFRKNVTFLFPYFTAFGLPCTYHNRIYSFTFLHITDKVSKHGIKTRPIAQFIKTMFETM